MHEKNTILEYLDLFLIFFSSLIALLFPSFALVWALVFSACVDHLFAVWKIKKLKENFNFWEGLWQTITKSFMYAFVVFISYIADRVFINDLITMFIGKPEIDMLFTKIMALILFANEIKSINNHYKNVKGTSIFSAIIGGIKKGREVADELKNIKEIIKN
jgi:hypothetical protein